MFVPTEGCQIPPSSILPLQYLLSTLSHGFLHKASWLLPACQPPLTHCGLTMAGEAPASRPTAWVLEGVLWVGGAWGGGGVLACERLGAACEVGGAQKKQVTPRLKFNVCPINDCLLTSAGWPWYTVCVCVCVRKRRQAWGAGSGDSQDIKGALLPHQLTWWKRGREGSQSYKLESQE